jgi:hypothetical protein
MHASIVVVYRFSLPICDPRPMLSSLSQHQLRRSSLSQHQLRRSSRCRTTEFSETSRPWPVCRLCGRCADFAAGVLSLAAGPRPCDCERSWAACVRLSTRQVLDLAASVSTFTLGAHSSDPWPLYPCINAEQVSWSGSTTGTRALQQDLAEGG